MRSLRIGAYDYRVEWLSNIPSDMLEQAGQHDSHEYTLRVVESANPQDTANTLLHEVLHALFETSALRHHPPFDRRGVEERCVRALTEGLLQVVRDNPALLLALVGLLKAGARG